MWPRFVEGKVRYVYISINIYIRAYAASHPWIIEIHGYDAYP